MIFFGMIMLLRVSVVVSRENHLLVRSVVVTTFFLILVFLMRISNVPLTIVLAAFYHFRSVEGSRHGFAAAEDGYIDFNEGSIHCERCSELLEQIDEYRVRIVK